MKPEARKCVICGQLGTEKWTLAKGPDLVVADLCLRHSQPMHDTVEAVEAINKVAPGKNPVMASSGPTVKSGKAPRGMVFEPLNWTPPQS